MKKKYIIQFLVLFIIFGTIYYFIELIYKYPNPTHWTMFVVGGLLAYVVGLLNNVIPWEMPFWQQCLYGGGIITFIEGISGVILNNLLGLNIWHYTKFTFFWGQCSLGFSCIWIVLSGVAIVLDDLLRYWLFDEEWPHYVWR